MSGLNLDHATTGDVLILAPQGRVDSSTAKTFESAALDAITSGRKAMVFDFADLVYISSAGLRVVLLAGKKLKAAGGALVLCNMNSSISDVFEISGFLALFDVRQSRDDAVDVAAKAS